MITLKYITLITYLQSHLKVAWIAFENFWSHAFLLFTCMQNYAAHERKSEMVKSASVAHAKH